MANANQKVAPSPAGESTSHVALRAAEIARDTVTSAELLEQVDLIAPELRGRRGKDVPVRRYMVGLERTITVYVQRFVEISIQLDGRLAKPNPVEAHLAAAEADALWVAKGMWEILRFLPEMDEGRVAVKPPARQLKPVTGVKGELVKRGISDDNQKRSLSVIQPHRLLRAARFGLQGASKGDRETEAAEQLGVEGVSPRAQNATMCLSVLADAIESGEIAVEGFSINVVRARLPGDHVRRRRVVRLDGAGADVFSVETVAWGRAADGSCCRFRVLDLGLTPRGDPAMGPSAALVQERIVDSLAAVSEMLPNAPRIVALPYDLPLGPPHAGRDVLTTRISDDRIADHVRAQGENRVPAADFAADLAPLLPSWTILAAVEPGRSNVYSLQERIRGSRKRAAFTLKTLRNHNLLEWLVTTPGAWENREDHESLRRVATEWQGEVNPDGLDQRRPAGHRVMYHGNIKEETVDAMTQAFLTYTLAEEIDLPSSRGG